uniref:tRNA 2-thiouridine(34) synthase MnmA n=1 Tax=Heterorhabditis bacteriophora TaxID=37862 RepID=A0A1I7WJ19_HETBA
MRTLRVAVGMSGGVDSAVSAWLLRKRGFDVVGVHMNNWDHMEEGTSQCSRTRDEADARYICDKLQIPFETVNFVHEYWNEVFV